MEKKYRHPTRRQYHKLPKGSLRMSHVPEAGLVGLVLYLNQAEEPQDKRIVQILEEMLELEKIEQPVWSTGVVDGPLSVVRKGQMVPNPAFRKIEPAKYARQLDVNRRESSINQKLAQYHFFPFATPPFGNKRWDVFWQQVRSGMPRKRAARREREVDDSAALEMILELARAGWLERLRHCLFCHRWLYARFRHQNFCSTKCQQKHYAQSPEWKEKRRDYMRDYRNRWS